MIYCDESGFTGAKLSDKDQTHFVYASVAMSVDRAAEIVREVREHNRINTAEIKGSSLLKSPRGRKAVSFIPLSVLIYSPPPYGNVELQLKHH